MPRGEVEMSTGEAAMGLALAVAGIAFSIGGYRMALFEDGVPGPGLLPFLAGIILAALGLLISAASLAAARRTAVPLADRDTLLAIALMLAAILAFEPLGFLPTTFLFLWTGFAVLGRAPPVRSALVAAAATVVTWALFVKALGVGLPAGLLTSMLLG